MKIIAVEVPCMEEQRAKLLMAAGKDAQVVFLEDLPVQQQEQVLTSAHAIIGEPDMGEIRNNPNLEWLQITWAGTDRYTIGQAFPEKVALCNMSGAFGAVIAEYVIGAILALYRRFPVYWRQQQDGIWQDAGSEEVISGKTVLFLGTGDIGTSVAVRMKAFGTYHIGVRRDTSKCPEGFDEIHGFEEVDALLGKADIVVCSLPNKPLTRGLLNEKRLLEMKQDAVLVNVGRGSLIDLDALDRVLGAGHLRGAVLDVTNPEPLPSGHPLWHRENVMITPHIAGPSWNHSIDTQNRIIDICCENIRRFLQGEDLLNRIKREEFEY